MTGKEYQRLNDLVEELEISARRNLAAVDGTDSKEYKAMYDTRAKAYQDCAEALRKVLRSLNE
jgi:hypothetical protein